MSGNLEDLTSRSPPMLRRGGDGASADCYDAAHNDIQSSKDVLAANACLDKVRRSFSATTTLPTTASSKPAGFFPGSHARIGRSLHSRPEASARPEDLVVFKCGQRFRNDIRQVKNPRSVFISIDQSVDTSQAYSIGFGSKCP